jgi:hypothetical protein
MTRVMVCGLTAPFVDCSRHIKGGHVQAVATNVSDRTSGDLSRLVVSKRSVTLQLIRDYALGQRKCRAPKIQRHVMMRPPIDVKKNRS